MVEAFSEFGVSRETAERLQRFATLFEKWAKSINLVAPSTRRDVVRRHLGDSLELSRLAPGDRKWIDLGTGGGFPGLVTAIVLAEAGHGWVDLVESNNRKAAFLRAAILETDARAAVHPIRIEAATEVLKGHDAVSARALAGLDELLELASPWLIEGRAEAWFHKGRDYRREVEQTHGRWRFDLLEHRSGIAPDSVILQIRNLERQ